MTVIRTSLPMIDYDELIMVFSHWKADRHEIPATFEIFFRKCPFDGGFCVFAGLNECIEAVQGFRISEKDCDWLKSVMPENTPNAFFDYLKSMRMDDVTMFAVDEGTPVFPHVPLIQMSGPLAKVQILQTSLLNSVNYASLICTNACRFVQAAEGRPVVEFGARKGQGPNGALTGSKYAYLGGCHSTSNVQAAMMYDIPLSGTIAHSYIMTFQGVNQLDEGYVWLKNLKDGTNVNFRDLCEKYKSNLENKTGISCSEGNKGELLAMISYAIANPHKFMVLVDTYNVIMSGLGNFCAVGLALFELGYRPLGIRLDSGDLHYLSSEAKRAFKSVAVAFSIPEFENLTVTASNDITEKILNT